MELTPLPSQLGGNKHGDRHLLEQRHWNAFANVEGRLAGARQPRSTPRPSDARIRERPFDALK